MRDVTNQLHVCHVVLSLNVGGLERVVVDLISRCRPLGQRATVVCLASTGTLAETARGMGAEVICLGKKPGLRPGLVGQLRRVFKDRAVDVVHTHQVGALCYAGPAARWAGVLAVVHTEHGKHYGSRWRTRMLGRFAASFVRRFFCVSADIAEEVIRCGVAPRDKVIKVANGIDVERFAVEPDAALRMSLNIPAGVPVVGTIGRLGEIKRQDVLVRGFAKLKERAPEARLLIVGDGPERGRLEALAGELGLSDSVHFAGYRSNPEAFLPLMNAFAITSRSEGMPLAVLEAWASGVAVVASSVGGLPEMMQEGKLGWLVPFGEEQALADALVKAIDSGNVERREKVLQALETVRASYSLDRVAGDYHRHYLELTKTSSIIPVGAAVHA